MSIFRSPVSEFHNARGQTLFSLIFILTVVFGLIGTTFAVSSYLQSILSAQRSFSEQAKEAASAGVEDALIRIVRDPNWLPSTSCSAGPPSNAFDVVVDDITVCVRVTDASTPSPQQRRRRAIDSSAVVRDSTRRICAIVEVSASGGVKVLSREERPNC